MGGMSLSELCKCNGAQVCIFCKILTAICIVVIGGIIGYFIGKKRR